MKDIIAAIDAFWFGELDTNGLCVEDRNSRWFSASEEVDNTCREEFGAALSRALEGKLDHWANTDRGLVALIVLLDQISRNMHRGTPMAFGGDKQALALALDAIDSDRHLRLPAIHRVFVYLPLEHHEDLTTQDRCVALFEALQNGNDDPQFAGFTRYARAHRDVIAQFGRFPHRNAILGRTSGPAELAYLDTHGGF